jgi:hypothetical protein
VVNEALSGVFISTTEASPIKHTVPLNDHADDRASHAADAHALALVALTSQLW